MKVALIGVIGSAEIAVLVAPDQSHVRLDLGAVFPRDLAHLRISRTERIARAHYRPGDFIFVEGEPAMSCYAIEQGEVEVLRRDAAGQHISWRC